MAVYVNESMNKFGAIRWAMNTARWLPARDQWLLANSLIQNEEVNRINSFVFRKDAKSALIGRLMMRRCIATCLSIPNEKIRLGRTENGKPYLLNNITDFGNDGDLRDFSFNISHQGNFCVLAAQRGPVGVDVMQIEKEKSGESLQEYFRIMYRQFHRNEWDFIRAGKNEWQQKSRFYRLWCLKESYLKAIGSGISTSLQNINFQCLTSELSADHLTTDSKLIINGEEMNGWIFEESLLDNEHCVAVGYAGFIDRRLDTNKLKNDAADTSQMRSLFSLINFDDLIKEAVPLNSVDDNLWVAFSEKAEKPTRH